MAARRMLVAARRPRRKSKRLATCAPRARAVFADDGVHAEKADADEPERDDAGEEMSPGGVVEVALDGVVEGHHGEAGGEKHERGGDKGSAPLFFQAFLGKPTKYMPMPRAMNATPAKASKAEPERGDREDGRRRWWR